MSFKDVLNKPLPSKIHSGEPFHVFISEDDIYEERKILDNVNLGKVSGVEIWVYPNEGPKPHCHLIVVDENKDRNGANRFETCIRLDTNMYFTHGTKIDKLNNKSLKKLCKVFRKKYKDTKMTVFTKLRTEWNKNSKKEYQIKDIYNMPNYVEIKDEKEDKKKNS